MKRMNAHYVIINKCVTYNARDLRYSAATVLHTNSDMYLTDLHTPSELNAPANTLCNAPHSDMYLTDLQPQLGHRGYVTL